MQLTDYIHIVAVSLTFVVAFIGAVVGLIGFVKNGVEAIANRKDDIRPFRDNYLNPLNVLYLPGRLTDRGKEARKRMLVYLALFVFCILIGVLGQHLTALP